MAYTDCNTIEFNSLTGIVRPIERYNGSTFVRSNQSWLIGDSFLNSPAIAYIEGDIDSIKTTKALFDKNYISFLNKIEKDYKLNNSEIPLQKIKEKFSIIYNDISSFNFEKMSVEFTFDNAIVFAIKNYNSKFMIQYFIDFNPNSNDDVEVIFSNLSNNSNKFSELRLEGIKSLIENELYSEVIL